VAEVGIAMCKALEALHARQIVHRDVRYYAGNSDALSGQPRACLGVGRQIKVNYLWAFAVTFPISVE